MFEKLVKTFSWDLGGSKGKLFSIFNIKSISNKWHRP